MTNLPETSVTNFPALDWAQITASLEAHHALFYQMWVLGKPIFDRSIPTAAVTFDEIGECVGFTFNPDFWEKRNLEEKKFIVCHECLHVYLEHGIRGLDTKDPEAANVTMDVIVNHMLVNNFGFDRDKMPISSELCWVDTVFAHEKDVKEIPTNSSFEYYMNRLPYGTSWRSIDDHSKLGSFGKILDKITNKLSDSEKESLNSAAGKGALGKQMAVTPGETKKKKKWETVIKQWSKKFNKPTDDSVEQWARVARRYANLSGDLFLPSDAEHEKFNEGKIQVWFFQDCSGSCANLKDRFFRAAKSLPPDRFDVKMHTFDDEVYEADLDVNAVYGFGGTSFGAVEKYIQKYIKQHNQDYPKAVFLISDGYGDKVKPEIPENWYWFLSTKAIYWVPEGSNYYELKDFE